MELEVIFWGKIDEYWIYIPMKINEQYRNEQTISRKCIEDNYPLCQLK